MLAVCHRREVAALHQLVYVLEQMICELEYRITPLPELCSFAAAQSKGSIQAFFYALTQALEQRISSDISVCTVTALENTPGIPCKTSVLLQTLGKSLGKFDLRGQVTSLRQCRQACLEQLVVLEHQQTQRLRSYQTLGFCAGAALAILLF